MNTTHNRTAATSHPFLSACSASCQKLLSKLQRAKQSLFEEFRPKVLVPDRMLRLALNEAEALAQQTGFPLLMFPTLAREKAEAVAAWNRRQQALRAHSFEMAA